MVATVAPLVAKGGAPGLIGIGVAFASMLLRRNEFLAAVGLVRYRWRARSGSGLRMSFETGSHFAGHAQRASDATTVAMNACMAITIATQAGQPPMLQVSPGRIAPKLPPT